MTHERDLRAFLNGVLRNPHLSEDAFQKTVIKAIETSTTPNTGNLKGWLFRIALNVARDLKRDLTREVSNRRTVHEVITSRSTAIDDSVTQLITAEEKELVNQALSRLSPNYRDVVIRRVRHGQTFAQIAEDLDRPLGTVLTWMKRALNELREMNLIRSLSDENTK